MPMMIRFTACVEMLVRDSRREEDGTYSGEDARDPERFPERRWLETEDESEEYTACVTHRTDDTAL